MQSIIPRHRLPDISFSRNGRIRISARVATALGIYPGDCIAICSHHGEFLIHAIKNPPGRCLARLHSSKGHSRNLCTNSVSISRAILDAAGISQFNASFPAGDPVVIDNHTYIPIITKLPL